MDNGKALNKSMVDQTLDRMEKQIEELYALSNEMVIKLNVLLRPSVTIKNDQGNKLEKIEEASPLVNKLEKDISKLYNVFTILNEAYQRLEI